MADAAGMIARMMESNVCRVVLDTNTVMALWVFADPGLQRLDAVLQTGRLVPVMRSDALEELRHVLAYPQFGLTRDRQIEVADAYAVRCLMLGTAREATPVVLPLCRDRDDQKFLEIARDGRASFLFTRDKALLKLARHKLVRPQFRIMTPDSFDDRAF